MRLLTAVFVRAGHSSVFSTGTCVTFITLGEAISDFKLLALVAADYNLITMSMKHYFISDKINGLQINKIEIKGKNL